MTEVAPKLPLAPVRARRPALDEAMTAPQAARGIATAALEQVQGNEDGALATSDPEFVHQLRIGLRRLRSGLRLLRDAIPQEAGAHWRRELGGVARALGEARDWDVFTAATLPPLAKAYGDVKLARSLAGRAQARRRKAREAGRAALCSPAYAHVVLELARWVATAEAPTPGPREPLAALASRLIRKRRKRLLVDARALERSSPGERHRVRIDTKRLRYGIEAFATLFKVSCVEKFLRRLSALQDALGRANDAATAARLLASLDPPAPFADFARGWLAARTAHDLEHAAREVVRLAEARRFWKRNIGSPEGRARSQ